MSNQPVIKRTLEIAFEELRSRLRALESREDDGQKMVELAQVMAALKAGLLQANEKATSELKDLEEERDSERDSVAPREMKTIVRQDLEASASTSPSSVNPSSPSDHPASPPPPPPPPPPPSDNTTIRVSVDAAVKMEEG